MNKNKTARLYRASLGKALSLSLSHPYLWVLGFLASLGITSGIFEGTINNILTVIRSQNFVGDVSQLYQGQSFDLVFGFFERFSLSLEYPLAALIGGFALVFFLIYITTLAHIALIQKTHKLYKGSPIRIERALPNAHHYFPNVLAVSLISKLLYGVVLIITTAPVIIALAVNNTTALATGLSLFVLLFFPLALLLAILTLYVTLYIVLYDRELFDAVRRGWILLTNNFLITVEIMGTLLLAYLGALIVTLLIASLIFIPLAFFIGAFLIIQQTTLFALLLALAVIIAVMSYFFLNGWYNAFYIGTTTILFDQLTSRELSSKVRRMIANVHRALNLTPMEKRAVAQLAKTTNTSAEVVMTTVERKIEEAVPALQRLVEKAHHAYEDNPQLARIEQDLKKIIKEEKESLLPTLKAVATTAQRDTKEIVKDAQPRVKKAVATTQKSLAEKFPHLTEIKEELQRKYAEEMERELARVFVQEPKLQQTPRKRTPKKPAVKKAAPKKSTTRKQSTAKKSTVKKSTGTRSSRTKKSS